MYASLQRFFVLLIFFLVPSAAIAQFSLIEVIPGQVDDDASYNTHFIIQAANGDVLVFWSKYGVVTNQNFPPQGNPAYLRMVRSTDAGASWSAVTDLVEAIPTSGSSGINEVEGVVMDNGDIILAYSYLNEPFPNYSVSHKVLKSSDHGATWVAMPDRTNASAGMQSAGGDTVISLDWADDGVGNLSIHASSLDIESGNWISSGVVVADLNNVCSWDLDTLSATEWVFYYSDCVFGTGGTNHLYRMVTTDSGANWSSPVELFTTDSGFGSRWGSVVGSGANKTAIYSSAFVFEYRTSADGGATWTGPTTWTGGTGDHADIWADCTESEWGPLCAFRGRRNSDNQLLHVGIPGVSGDPLLGATAVESAQLPTAIALAQSYPNPFRGSATIEFVLETGAETSLKVFNALGIEVANLSSGYVTAGMHSVQFDASHLPAGVYFYRLNAAGSVSTKQMTLFK